MIAGLNILANTLAQLDRADEAMALVNRALATEQETGPNPETLASRNILAGFLQKAGQLDAAAAQFETLLKQMPDIIGKEHINYAIFTSNSADLDLAMGDKATARRKLEEVLPMLQARFGEEHARTVEAKARLERAQAP